MLSVFAQQSSRWGRSILFIIGFGLIVYGLFACLNAYPAKIFPTPLPSEVCPSILSQVAAIW